MKNNHINIGLIQIVNYITEFTLQYDNDDRSSGSVFVMFKDHMIHQTMHSNIMLSFVAMCVQ